MFNLLFLKFWVLYRYVPSIAALPILRPAIGRQESACEQAKVAMQGYLNHFLGNMDIVNSREVITLSIVDAFLPAKFFSNHYTIYTPIFCNVMFLFSGLQISRGL